MCLNLIKYGRIKTKSVFLEDNYLDCSSDESLKVISDAYRLWADDYSAAAGSSSKYPLEFYCGEYFRNINGCLRNYYEDMSPLASRNEDIRIQELKDIILNAPRLPENVIVYRGVWDYFAKLLVACNKSSSCTTELGFMSTTLMFDRYDKLEEFKNYKHILKIYATKGTPAIYIDQIRTRYITGREEQEILFLPGVSLKMIKYPYRRNGRMIYECIML